MGEPHLPQGRGSGLENSRPSAGGQQPGLGAPSRADSQPAGPAKLTLLPGFPAGPGGPCTPRGPCPEAKTAVGQAGSVFFRGKSKALPPCSSSQPVGARGQQRAGHRPAAQVRARRGPARRPPAVPQLSRSMEQLRLPHSQLRTKPQFPPAPWKTCSVGASIPAASTSEAHGVSPPAAGVRCLRT